MQTSNEWFKIIREKEEALMKILIRFISEIDTLIELIHSQL